MQANAHPVADFNSFPSRAFSFPGQHSRDRRPRESLPLFPLPLSRSRLRKSHLFNGRHAERGHEHTTSSKVLRFWTPSLPLSVPNSRNLPSFGQKLANSLPPLRADVICTLSQRPSSFTFRSGSEARDERSCERRAGARPAFRLLTHFVGSGRRGTGNTRAAHLVEAEAAFCEVSSCIIHIRKSSKKKSVSNSSKSKTFAHYSKLPGI